jgi:hypothetical protein
MPGEIRVFLCHENVTRGGGWTKMSQEKPLKTIQKRLLYIPVFSIEKVWKTAEFLGFSDFFLISG